MRVYAYVTRRLLALGAICWLAAGCGWYRTHFPAREEVFKPIPLEVGERRINGADTLFAVGGDGFELVVPDQELLPDAKRTLDYTAREFGRVFGVVPPPVVVEVAWRDAERGARRAAVDSSYRRPDGRRAIVVSVPRPPKDRRQREMMLRYAPPLIGVAPAVARAWLSGHVDGAPPPASASASAPASVHVEWTLRDDPRLPDWMEDGLVALVAPAFRQDQLDALLVRERDRLPALGDFFAAARPGRARDGVPGEPIRTATQAAGTNTPADRPPDDVAGEDEPGRARMRVGSRSQVGRVPFGPAERFHAQAHSVMQFLARREGRAFVGRVLDRVVDGEPIERALAGARTLPTVSGDPTRIDVAALDRTWRAWLAQRGDLRDPASP